MKTFITSAQLGGIMFYRRLSACLFVNWA